MKKSLLIYTIIEHARIHYVFQQVFGDWMGLDVQITTDIELAKKSSLPKVSYGRFLKGAICIPAHPAMMDTMPKWEVGSSDGTPTLFPISTSQSYWCNFDLPAMFFHLLSRSEEYIPTTTKDALNRYNPTQSIAYRAGFLELPVVDIWTQRLHDKLKSTYPQLPLKTSIYQLRSTVDVDYLWAYEQRSVIRKALSIGKDLCYGNLDHIKLRWKVWRGQKTDPYFTFPEIQRWHQAEHHYPIHYFVHVGNWARYDRPNHWKRSRVQEAFRWLDKNHRVGLHPSVQAYRNPIQLQKELCRLTTILNRPVTCSRQHFICLSLPRTYRQLLAAGILHDYSMGYARRLGYRAGTTRPYMWYDLLQEKATPLQIHPFSVMDATLKRYLALSPAKAWEELQQMRERHQAWNLPLTIIWHNSSLSELNGWQGWREVYQSFLQDTMMKTL